MPQSRIYNDPDRMKSNPGTKAQFRELLREAGVNFELSDRFYRDIVLSMNGAKGRTGEFLVQASVLNLLRAGEDQRVATMPKTQHTLGTPAGYRRIDLYFAESRFAIEIKSGYVRANHQFREQVGKDVWLLENRGKVVAEVMWIFLRGATKPARRHLDARRIAWMDLDLDQMRTPVTSAWPESKSPLTNS
jgi:hypothetical protein